MPTKRITAQSLYERLKAVQVASPLCAYTRERCEELVPLINEIEELKSEKKAIILAHSYVHPDILYGVADHVGDSYALAKWAMNTEADIILFPSVRFMAETAKILSPDKIVIDPNPNGGCTLAESITADQVALLRTQYPEHTFVCYINTTAEVKAQCDVCVTSANALKVIKAINNDKIFFLPDKLMAQNLQREILEKQILYSDGSCYVHEAFTPEELDAARTHYPLLTVLAHPECRPSVVEKADHVASTTGMYSYVMQHQEKMGPFLLLTECGIASRLQAELPKVKLVGSCMLCKYMKSNSLQDIKRSLLAPTSEQIISLNPHTLREAKRCLDAMFILENPALGISSL